MQKLSLSFMLACAAGAVSMSWAGPIGIGSSTQSLAFGSVAAGSGGSVTVTANPVGRSAGGGVVLLPSGSWSAASFSVTGDPNATYAITLPALAALTSGANAMTVDNFKSYPASTGQLGGGGSQTLMVGATLGIAPNQASGAYSGSFTVTVDYN